MQIYLNIDRYTCKRISMYMQVYIHVDIGVCFSMHTNIYMCVYICEYNMFLYTHQYLRVDTVDIGVSRDSLGIPISTISTRRYWCVLTNILYSCMYTHIHTCRNWCA